MYRRVLLLCDLEGVNNVVGEPYLGLSKGTDQWKIAAEQAALELNAAADALFAAGVETVGVWDNHGGGENIDPSRLDPRIHLHAIDKTRPRMYFAQGAYDAVCFFGYHAMEGTLGGVLAHTMNSKANQFYRLNGNYVGEVDMDAYIAAEHGIPALFFAGGDIACSQAKRILPEITTVITKREISRNEAQFRDNAELLADIRQGITAALCKSIAPSKLSFPATFEKSFKRVEDAALYLARLTRSGIAADYPADEILGRDAHTVVSTVKSMKEFIICI
jgi:D-amino peptidase